MKHDLISLANEYPNMQVSITLADLVEAFGIFLTNAKSDYLRLIAEENSETYPSRKEVMEKLNVSSATLWRWAKDGLLVPHNVGGKNRYRMSDVERILKGNNAQKGVAK